MAEEHPTPEQPATSPIRHVIESLLLLAVTVLIFRTFAAEGYLISTGSMAPCLLGYHRQVTCPTCSHQFARGMSLAEAEGSSSIASTASASVGDPHGISGTACPNCGRTGLTINSLPKNEGDQLLVNKHAFMLRNPHRWEVIVFRNPSDPLEAYVKRAVGLPGEMIEIKGGEVFANGVQQRKTLTAQIGTRILVDEHSHQPDPENVDWEPRWSAEADESQWTETTEGFTFGGTAPNTPLDWLEFRHWVVAGGSHESQVPLAQWPKSLVRPAPEFTSLFYDTQKQLLTMTGVLSAEVLDRWTSRTTNETFLKAMKKLYFRSHYAPISDEYGYNQRYEGVASYRVRDVMLEFEIDHVPSSGQLTVRLAHGHTPVDCQFDFAARTLNVTCHAAPAKTSEVSEDFGSLSPMISTPLPRSFQSGSHQIIASVFDGQLVVGIDEEPLGEPLLLPESAEEPPAPWVERVARLGAQGASLSVRNLRLYRDVYYTPKNNADGKKFQLASDEYFALGDNSPVSLDSRCWESPGVPERSLIGKPFVVHLPSRPGRIALGGKVTYVRVPDFSRVRYIR